MVGVAPASRVFIITMQDELGVKGRGSSKALIYDLVVGCGKARWMWAPLKSRGTGGHFWRWLCPRRSVSESDIRDG